MMRLDHLVTYSLSTSRTFNQKVDDSLLILYNFEILGSCCQGSPGKATFFNTSVIFPLID